MRYIVHPTWAEKILIFPKFLEIKFSSSFIKLTKTEFDIFNVLISQKNQQCSKLELLKIIYHTLFTEYRRHADAASGLRRNGEGKELAEIAS